MPRPRVGQTNPKRPLSIPGDSPGVTPQPDTVEITG
jgi:hypothetical protein